MPPPVMQLPACDPLSRTLLRATTVSLAPMSAIPMPPYAGVPEAGTAGHERLFAVTALSWTDTSPAPLWVGSPTAATTMPAQLPCTLLSVIRPPSAERKRIPVPRLP